MTKLREYDNGEIQISDDVIGIIAGTAALEINGVLPVTAGFAPNNLADMLMKRNFSRGVVIEKSDEGITVRINILVKLGFKINNVSAAVQERIKEAVETMTGIDVLRVDVTVSGVVPAKERRAVRASSNAQKPARKQGLFSILSN